MLQIFYLDVAKVDLDVAYVAMPIHICFRRMLQMFHLDVSKVDRGVARRGRWLADSGLLQPPVAAAGVQPWVNPRGFPCADAGWAQVL